MIADEIDTARLLDRLLSVRADAIEAADRRRDDLASIPTDLRASADNLLHYLAVRGVDLRVEQLALAERGLSSLGRAEAHVLATVDAVIRRLAAELAGTANGSAALPDDLGAVGPTARQGRRALDEHAQAALGPPPEGARTRVMVTLPTEAASDPTVVDRFVEAGMAVARINAAHDDPDVWIAMAEQVRRSAQEHGRVVRIMVDLPGPKMRTGPIAPGPAVVKVRPDRDEFGRLVRDGRFVIRDAAGADEPSDLPVVLAVGDAVAGAEPGDRIKIDDARGRKRLVTVLERSDDALVVGCDRTVYLVPGLDLVRLRSAKRVGEGRIVRVPARPGVLHLSAGDQLLVHVGERVGRDAQRARTGEVEVPASIAVDVPELFDVLRPGMRVLFDDGSIDTVVEEVGPHVAVLRVERPDRGRLRAGKGINVPDVDLGIHALGDDDRAIVAAVAGFADLIAMSYVSRPDDVADLHRELDRLGAHDVGVVLKIEHRVAFEHLPDLLLTAMRRPPVAVMVARGDLAVELGYQRLAEVQEEVLWLSEAAHVPVIWATQVLESLAKRGAPTRAEVTDAALSGRAECVMLNKGPYIPETIEFLHDVLGRMSEHQSKRMPMLRRLSVAASAWRAEGGQGDGSA